MNDSDADLVFEQAHDLVDHIEEAAWNDDAEAVLDGIDAVVELYGEFPTGVWDATALLARSRHSMVRVGMAARGVPLIYNSINPFLALQLAGWLSEDRDRIVRETMTESLQRLDAGDMLRKQLRLRQ